MKQNSNERKGNQISMYSVYDIKGERFDTPFFCPSDLFAERHFVQQIRRGDNMISQFKDEFVLMRLAHYDNETGELTVDTKKTVIIEGKQINTEV